MWTIFFFLVFCSSVQQQEFNIWMCVPFFLVCYQNDIFTLPCLSSLLYTVSHAAQSDTVVGGGRHSKQTDSIIKDERKDVQ